MIALYFTFLIIYIAAINIAGFVAMSIDKRKAARHLRRVSEKTLFFIAFAGGSIGALLGMYAFRHKTKHLRFQLGIPLFLLLQIALIIYIIKIRG